MEPQDVRRVRLPSRRAEAWLLAADLAISAAALFVVPALIALGLDRPPPDLASCALAAGLGFLLLIRLAHLGHYERRRPAREATFDVLVWTAGLGAGHVAIAPAAGLDPGAIAAGWLALALLIPAGRHLVRHRLDRLGLWSRPTVVVGTGESARRIVRALDRAPSLGLPVVALAALDHVAGEPIRIGERWLPVLPAARMAAAGGAATAAHLIVAPEPHDMEPALDLLDRLAASGPGVDFVPPLGGLAGPGDRLVRFAGEVTSFRIRERLGAPVARHYKRAFDLAFGAAITLFVAPLMGVLASLILIFDGAPVLYRQERIGLHGRPFGCLKFRTMVPDADARLAALLETSPGARAEWARDRKLKDDPRISRVGGFLRKTSLDELPQLWNVLKGEMSLIGPRPVVRDELAHYGDHAALYLKTRPGLSGLWQVSGRNDVDYQRRVALDCQYVRQWSPSWDLALLFETVRAVLTRRGAY